MDDDWLGEHAGLPDEDLSIEEDRKRTRAAAKAGLAKAAQVLLLHQLKVFLSAPVRATGDEAPNQLLS